eukprot:NODE_450_length_8384_cov_0.353530.p3 type:complete len:315 gc:universal NODE_450_length_8384_cov_0.353530:2933-1989(-)
MSIQIINVKSENISSQYVVYEFTLNYENKQEWKIKKRYSDFITLHVQLNPPFLIPPKRYFSTSASVVEERKIQLRQYLLQCIQFINHPVFREFIGLDKELDTLAVEKKFENNFYSDLQTIENQIDKIETLIQKRVECVRNNQIHQSYKINQEIQQIVAPLKDYLPTLLKLMQSDQNGSEMNRKMKSYREVEMKIQSIIKGIQESPRKRVFGNSTPSSVTSIPIAHVPGTFNKSQSAATVYSNASTSLPNAQLMLQTQDQSLSLIMQSLRVQKQIGIEMNTELSLQNKLMDDINTDIDKIERKVQMVNKRAKKLA